MITGSDVLSAEEWKLLFTHGEVQVARNIPWSPSGGLMISFREHSEILSTIDAWVMEYDKVDTRDMTVDEMRETGLI